VGCGFYIAGFAYKKQACSLTSYRNWLVLGGAISPTVEALDARALRIEKIRVPPPTPEILAE
jgi:hypothetical protein